MLYSLSYVFNERNFFCSEVCKPKIKKPTKYAYIHTYVHMYLDMYFIHAVQFKCISVETLNKRINKNLYKSTYLHTYK